MVNTLVQKTGLVRFFHYVIINFVHHDRVIRVITSVMISRVVKVIFLQTSHNNYILKWIIKELSEILSYSGYHVDYNFNLILSVLYVDVYI